jgi:phage-related protein
LKELTYANKIKALIAYKLNKTRLLNKPHQLNTIQSVAQGIEELKSNKKNQSCLLNKPKFIGTLLCFEA